MLKLFAIMAGGGIGATFRYGLFLAVQGTVGAAFPSGTLAANLLGSLLIGFFWSAFEGFHFTHEMRLFLFTGLLGGFTTFSTFTRETAQLFQVGSWKTALVYITVSNVFGVLFVFLGYRMFRVLPFFPK